MDNNYKTFYDKKEFDKAQFKEALFKVRINTVSRNRRIEQLKTQNRIIRFLKFNFVSMRKDIVLAIDKPRTTIYDNLKLLKDLNIVDNTTIKLNKTKGRPITLWYLSKDMKDLSEMFNKIGLIMIKGDNLKWKIE